ncbi:hypothetical protein GCM10007989_37250 [Devosia pacifica]|uniref:Nudix hydrolase domain-containing protein n=1 Tax=Devosia pacifica TaxID=1335967 RepID=A0A918SE14_9HYPH|nr:NUDIX domain-containing protein [Devosia pacifica]GHA37906.1 hypothetical protein GCM10007989_37250 [Devosia pacifica]
MIPRQMLSFPLDGMRFNYRVAAIIIVEGHLLVSREDDDDYTMLPGGRVELGETSSLALERELREETGYEAAIGELILTSETLYRRDGEAFHELGIFYAARLPQSARPDGRSPWLEREDEGHQLYFDWVPLEAGALYKVRLLPEWLANTLPDIEGLDASSTKHVIADYLS